MEKGLQVKTILQIIIKNTSTLDYTIPLLWSLKKTHPNYNVIVLYAVSDKRQILRNSTFINSFFKENSIKQYDLIDFLPIVLRPMKSLFRMLFFGNYSDATTTPYFSAKRGFFENIYYSLVSYIRPVERLMFNNFINLERVLSSISPDLILFDNRSRSQFIGMKDFYKYVNKNNPPLVLLPHAPHYIDEKKEGYVDFDETRPGYFPGNIEFWRPFDRGKHPFLADEFKRQQFVDIGYPAFDDVWAKYIQDRRSSKSGNNEKVKILILARRFVSKGKIRKKGDDPFVMDYCEVLGFFKCIANTKIESHTTVEFIIKPHPSGNRSETEDLIVESGLRNWSITYESYYSILQNIDCVIGHFSTSLLLPIRYSIPTIIIDSPLQNYVHSSWKVLADLYTGFSFFTSSYDDNVELQKMLDIVINGGDMVTKLTNNDVEHLKSYFKFDVLNKAISHISNLTAN